MLSAGASGIDSSLDIKEQLWVDIDFPMSPPVFLCLRFSLEGSSHVPMAKKNDQYLIRKMTETKRLSTNYI